MNQKQFYKTKLWQKARQAYIDVRIAFDGGLCEVCRQELGKVVHHKIWLDDKTCNDPDISLNPDNFRYECQTCHNKEKDPRRPRVSRFIFGPNGELLRDSEY